MANLEYAVGFVVGYSLVLYHGLSFVLKLVLRFLSNPGDHFWKFTPRELPPACLEDPAWKHCYIQLKNIKLHYVEAGDQTKPLMLLVHGFPEFWYSWRHQIKEFSSDYWVVAVDLRGYGESEKPNGKKYYGIEYIEEDIKNLIKALGRERCTLVAHDWGGCIAWCLVLKQPQMFESYVIMNSIHPEAFHQHMKKSISQLRKSWYVFFYQWPWLPEISLSLDNLKTLGGMLLGNSVKSPSPMTMTEEDIEAYKFYYGKPGAFTPPINYYRANFLLSYRERLLGLGKSQDFPPGLILFGDRDIFIDKQIQEDTIALVANTTLVYVKDANHFVQQDDPATVNQEMRYFFKKISNSK